MTDEIVEPEDLEPGDRVRVTLAAREFLKNFTVLNNDVIAEQAAASEREARERAVRLSTAAAVALAALKAEVVEVVGWIADRAGDGRRTAALPVIAREARDLLAKLKPADTPSSVTATDTGRNT